MLRVTACVFIALISCYVKGQDDYALEFPKQGVTDYVNIWGMRSLTRFTVCFWMKTTTAGSAPVSYAPTNSLNNELIVFDPANFHLYVGNDRRSMGITANDNKWHQICATWKSKTGEWKSYKDGDLVQSGTDFKKGYTIHADGSLVLGQEQDSVGGSFDSNQSFAGKLVNVNVWSYVLPDSVIKELSKCCMAGEGNVYKWNDFLYGIKGNVRLWIPSRCPCTY